MKSITEWKDKPAGASELLKKVERQIGILQQAQKVVCSFSASRSHAPAWEYIPYELPRWSMGTRQEPISEKYKPGNEGCQVYLLLYA